MKMKTSLHKLLASDNIPTLPEIAIQIVEAAQQTEPDFAEITRLIRSDGAISSRILRTVNSALFGLHQRVSSIESAVPVLGSNLVRTLVLSFTLSDNQSNGGPLESEHQRLWRSSVTQAVVAESLGYEIKTVDESVWFLGGLLQDIGRLAMFTVDPAGYRDILLGHWTDDELLAAESKAFGFTHVEASTQLAIRWRLDNYIVDAISKHHGEVLAPKPESTQPPSTLAQLPNALRCANLCGNYLEALRTGHAVDRGAVEQGLADGFQFEPDEVDEFLRDVDLRVNEVSASFSLDIGQPIPIAPLLARAKASLAQIAVQSQLEVSSVKRHIQDARRDLEKIHGEAVKARRKSNVDEVTGVSARQTLTDAIEGARKAAEKRGEHLGVVFVDVDRFKSVNDGYGHQVGDVALRSVADVIGDHLNDREMVVRYGGDEFVVVLVRANMDALVRLSESIRQGVETIQTPNHPDLSLSCSVGVLGFRPEDNLPTAQEELLNEADQAMYAAKNGGGNRVVACEMRGGIVAPISTDASLSTS